MFNSITYQYLLDASSQMPWYALTHTQVLHQKCPVEGKNHLWVKTAGLRPSWWPHSFCQWWLRCGYVMPPIKSAGTFLERFSSISENDRRMRRTFFLFLVVVMTSHDGQMMAATLGPWGEWAWEKSQSSEVGRTDGRELGSLVVVLWTSEMG